MPRGRVKGSMNNDRKGLMARIQKAVPGYDAVVEMAKIAADESNDMSLRMTAHKEVAKYTAPQLKAVELTGHDGGGIELNVNTGIHRDDGS